MTCPICGAPLGPNDFFCSQCGCVIKAREQGQNIYRNTPPQAPPPMPNYVPPSYAPPEYAQSDYAHQNQQNALGNIWQSAYTDDPLKGTFGAVCGALLGAAVTALFMTFGRIAAVSGAVLAFCTLYGYAHFGRGLGKRGIIICAALMLIMPYIAFRIGLAGMISYETGRDFFMLIERAPRLVNSGDYAHDLVLIYVFTLIGAVPSIKKFFGGETDENDNKDQGIYPTQPTPKELTPQEFDKSFK